MGKLHGDPKVGGRSFSDEVGGFKNHDKFIILPYRVCWWPLELVALIQEEVGAECTRVHHKVYKYDHNIGHLPKEPIGTSQISGGST